MLRSPEGLNVFLREWMWFLKEVGENLVDLKADFGWKIGKKFKRILLLLFKITFTEPESHFTQC